ncbi:MAG TPA: hypothetical protein VGL25_07785 [Casimicrobiaceae bacterium]
MLRGFALASISVGSTLVAAYDVDTHAAISQKAAEVSSLTNSFSQLGLMTLTIDDPRQAFRSSEGGAPRSILELIELGAKWEDNLGITQHWFQPLRHFYDPVYDRGLDVGGSIGSSWSVKSPDWALEELTAYNGSPGPLAYQDFSLRDARDYLYGALTANSEAQRKGFFGRLFQTVGHVMHHLQDMAQPQHVRNDPHCDQAACVVLTSALGLNQIFGPSLFEKYTDLDHPTDPLRQVRRNLPFLSSGSDPVFPPGIAANNPFKKPRDFWRTTAPGSDIGPGKGISEYTNRNFFSAGTISTPYSSPHWPTVSDWYSPSEVANIQTLLPGTSLSGTVHFFATSVTDALSGTSVENKRALSDALLDGDLAQVYSSTGNGGYLVFALNRFNYDAAHQLLIPRAVAYSAGLINYFFRGQLEITLPDEGVYGIIDHTIDNQPNVDGFHKIKLKIKNVTSAGTDQSGQPVIELIPNNSPGTLLAIAKFHRNNCYRSDLGGEYGSPGVDWQSCRASSEEIVVSQPQTVPAGINQSATPVSFSFPNPIPINATDLYLQVVYRGPLGEEPDGIAVATKDISEPTYIYVFNTWDQYLYCAYGIISSEPPCAKIYTFKESFCDQLHPQLTYEQCKAHEGQTFKFRSNPIASPVPGYDPANPAVSQGEWFDIARESPFVPISALPTPVGSFTRVAMLLDLEAPADPYLLVSELGVGAMASQFQWWQASGYVPTVNQVSPIDNAIVISRHYAQARGVYVETTPYDWNPAINDHYLLSSGTDSNIPPLVLVPSPINF